MLSASVANALTLEGGEEASETFRFVALMDCFFDALNVGSFDVGYKERKEFKFPYRSANDWRLDVSSNSSYKYVQV